VAWPGGAVVYVIAVPPLIDKAEHPGEFVRFVAERLVAPRHALEFEE